MSNKPDRDVLEEMHWALAQKLLERVQSGEATPQELNCARQFLKDNNVEALATSGSPMASLAADLPFGSEDSSDEDHITH